MKKLYILVLWSVLSFAVQANDSVMYSKKADDPIKITRFYPNPATTVINFEFPKEVDKTYSIQLYNFMGKKLIDVPVTDSKLTFSLDSFYRGLYIFQLRDKTGNIVESGKFQVVK
jgi:hypothetical protein